MHVLLVSHAIPFKGNVLLIVINHVNNLIVSECVLHVQAVVRESMAKEIPIENALEIRNVCRCQRVLQKTVNAQFMRVSKFEDVLVLHVPHVIVDVVVLLIVLIERAVCNVEQ